MDEYTPFDPENLQARWVAYFDLLGITELIESNRIISVFNAYSLALKELGRGAGQERLGCAWFSDTFVLWSKEASAEGFPAEWRKVLNEMQKEWDRLHQENAQLRIERDQLSKALVGLLREEVTLSEQEILAQIGQEKPLREFLEEMRALVVEK